MLTNILAMSTLGGVMDPPLFGNAGVEVAKALSVQLPRVSLQLTGRDHCVLLFAPEDDVLSDKSLDALHLAWESIKGDATLGEILVLAYADADYPRAYPNKLPRAARRLAEARGAVVRDCLLDLGATNVAIYNMAKRPNWLQDLLLTADAQVKHEVLGDGRRPVDSFYQEVGQFLEAEGGPGKVFIVMRKDKLYAH